MKTSIYVDGLNLYYGCLRGTRYKWLDLRALFGKILPSAYEITHINYFAAIVKGDKNPDAQLRQKAYVAALTRYNKPEFKMYPGAFSQKINPRESLGR